MGNVPEERAARIRMVLLDVDGVLTDSSVTLNGVGGELKRFNTKDGLGLKFLMDAGVEVALVSGRNSEAVRQRARELGIREVHQGSFDKLDICRRLMDDRGLSRDEVCSVGDDIIDLAMFSVSGIRFAVADAVDEVRNAADVVLTKAGGCGAVREVCELLLNAKGRWAEIVASYQGKSENSG